MSFNEHLRRGLALITLSLFFIGCGGGAASDAPDLGQVSGVVTMDGKPLEGAMVTFEPTGAAALHGKNRRRRQVLPSRISTANRERQLELTQSEFQSLLREMLQILLIKILYLLHITLTLK